MSNIEREKYLPYLDRFLHYCGMEIKADGQMRCPNNSAHNNGDKNFSAKLYRNEGTGHSRVKCFACGFDGDVYDMVGHVKNETEFVKQYNILEEIFGGISSMTNIAPPAEQKKEKEKLPPVNLVLEEARKIYNDENFNRVRKFSKNEINQNGVIRARWQYDDIDGNIAAVDVRIEDVQTTPGVKPKKNVISFWYNGKTLKMSDGPFLIYNLFDSVKGSGKGKPKIIHEGAKCAELGEKSLSAFSHISYNRGGQNADKPNWKEYYKDDVVYILQDNDGPGLQAAAKIKTQLPQAIILKTIYSHFEIDDVKGADIEQLLEQTTPSRLPIS